METYVKMKKRHQKEMNDFPMFFAFTKEDFEEGMKKLGLNPFEVNKIYKFGNTGGFYKKEDSKLLHEMLERHSKELQKAIENDKIGDGFIFEMFDYELGNHEYAITYDVEETLNALGLTIDEVNKDEHLSYGLNKACENQLKKY